MAAPERLYDALIVGGGPAGLSAALLLGRACRRVVVIDAGRPRNAAARELHGFIGRDGTPPQDLLTAGRSQLPKYGVEFVAQEVRAAERLPDGAIHGAPTAFSIVTMDRRAFVGRKLLFATGTRDALPDFPGVRECYGATIHHCPYCDAWEHRGERILVYGNETKEAVGLALGLKGWSREITVLADGRTVEKDQWLRMKKQNIDCATEKIIRFLHHDGQLDAVELADGAVLKAKAMFFQTSQQACCDLPKALGVLPNEDFSGRTTTKQKTNVPGLFLAGDADGDVQFAIVAAAEGATAAVAINRELQEEDQA